MLKVMHFIPSMQRGGAERQVACIVQNCSDFEHWLITLYLDQDNYLENSSKLKIIRSRKILSRLREFKSLTMSIKPEVIYAWGVLPYLLAIFATRGREIKVINGSIRHGVFKRSLGGYLRLVLLHTSKYVVANSRAGLQANRLKRGFILYNGIDERFNRDRFHSPYGSIAKSDMPVLISVANLVPYKDYETIFKALGLVKQAGIAFYYLIIGDGALRQIHESTVESLGLKDDVAFIGRVPNPEDYLARSDIFIHSSKGEGCSNAVLEAMYMGLPVVATETGGTSEILGENAFIFTYRDHEALYTYLLRLIQDPDLRRQMGEESYRIARDRFTIPRMISVYGRIIRAVANDNLADIPDLRYSSRV